MASFVPAHGRETSQCPPAWDSSSGPRRPSGSLISPPVGVCLIKAVVKEPPGVDLPWLTCNQLTVGVGRAYALSQGDMGWEGRLGAAAPLEGGRSSVPQWLVTQSCQGEGLEPGEWLGGCRRVPSGACRSWGGSGGLLPTLPSSWPVGGLSSFLTSGTGRGLCRSLSPEVSHANISMTPQVP